MSVRLPIWRLKGSIGRGIDSLLDWYPNAVYFVAGILTSVAMKLSPPTLVEAERDARLSWSLVAFAVFIALSIASLVRLRRQISSEIDRSRLNVRFYFKTSDEDSDQQIYDPIIMKIQGAKRSIRVFGSFRNPDVTLKPSAPRSRYFSEIESVIRKKIASGDAFHYERLVQVKSVSGLDLPFIEVTTLRESEVDALTYQHCGRIMAIAAGDAGRVQIFLRQMSPVMPMVTLIIIDDEYVIICLPWIDRSERGLDLQQLGKGMIFHDIGTNFCTEMIAMFNVLAHSAPPILKMEK